MQVCVHFYLIFRRKGTREEQGVLQSKCLLLGYVKGSTMTNEYPTNHQGINNDSYLERRIKEKSDTIRRNERKKKNALHYLHYLHYGGESAESAESARQKNDMRQLRF